MPRSPIHPTPAAGRPICSEVTGAKRAKILSSRGAEVGSELNENTSRDVGADCNVEENDWVVVTLANHNRRIMPIRHRQQVPARRRRGLLAPAIGIGLKF